MKRNERKITLGMTELEYQLVSSLALHARLNLTNYLRQCVGLRLRNYVRPEVLASIRAFEAEARTCRPTRLEKLVKDRAARQQEVAPTPTTVDP